MQTWFEFHALLQLHIFPQNSQYQLEQKGMSVDEY